MLRGAASAPATSFPRPPLPYRTEQTALGAPLQPLRVIDRLPGPPSSAATRPRLLSCGAPHSPREAAGGHFLPRRPPARPAPLPEPGRATSAGVGTAGLPSSGNRPLRPPAPAVRGAKGNETEEATETENGRASNLRRDGRAPGRRARPGSPHPHRAEGSPLTRLPAVGAAAVPGDLQQLLQQRLVAVAVHHRRPARSSAGGARREARPRQAKGGTPWGPPRAEGPPRLRTGSR